MLFTSASPETPAIVAAATIRKKLTRLDFIPSSPIARSCNASNSDNKKPSVLDPFFFALSFVFSFMLCSLVLLATQCLSSAAFEATPVFAAAEWVAGQMPRVANCWTSTLRLPLNVPVREEFFEFVHQIDALLVDSVQFFKFYVARTVCNALLIMLGPSLVEMA